MLIITISRKNVKIRLTIYYIFSKCLGWSFCQNPTINQTKPNQTQNLKTVQNKMEKNIKSENAGF